MPLSNAERQARYRARIKQKLRDAAAWPTSGATCLSAEEAMARRAFLADPPGGADEREAPPRRFMGLTRDEWTRAPDELAAHFGLSEAVARWGRRRAAKAAGRSGIPETWTVEERALEEVPRWLRRPE